MYSKTERLFFVLREDAGLRMLETTEGDQIHLADLGAAVIDRVDRGDLDGASKLLDWAVEAERVNWGEYREFWQQSENKSEHLSRTVATALRAAVPSRSQEAIATLEAGPAKTFEIDKGLARDRRLLTAYKMSGNNEKAFELALKILREDPKNDAVVREAGRLLTRLGRREEALAVFDARIEAADETELLDLKMRRAILAGDSDARYSVPKRMEHVGFKGYYPWNNLVWSSLVTGKVDKRAKVAIDHASRLSDGRSGYTLNTQAAI